MQGGNDKASCKTHEHYPASFIEFTEEITGRHLHLYGVGEKPVKRVDGDH